MTANDPKRTLQVLCIVGLNCIHAFLSLNRRIELPIILKIYNLEMNSWLELLSSNLINSYLASEVS